MNPAHTWIPPRSGPRSPGKTARISVINLVGVPPPQRPDFVGRLEATLFGHFKANPVRDRPLGGLLVLDEVQVFVPATGSTPSGEITKTLIAQARKYGLGVLLATQMPKGLHNSVPASQFIGRLTAPVQKAAANQMAAARGSTFDNISRLVPGTGSGMADFLLPAEATGTMEQQIDAVAMLPAERLGVNLHTLWPQGLPPLGQDILSDAAGTRRIADALWNYWTVALNPYWDEIRAVIDDDIVYRATILTRGGVAAMFEGLHDKVNLAGDVLQVGMTQSADRQLTGAGIRLVPSVFAWPYIVFDIGASSPRSLVYPARGVGNLWNAVHGPRHNNPLAELLGRSRAAILAALAVPGSTTALARRLGHTPPAISQHLSILRRSGLVTSRRSGRSVHHQLTILGRSVVEACADAPDK